MAKLYALLAGINDYSRTPANDLGGCVKDIEFYETFLKDRYVDALQLQVLKDSEAERENIIDGFRNHLGKAGKEDVALFVYAGHGARWKSAEAFKAFYPDGYDEGLVCHNSRSESDAFPYDLADKELAMLVHELAKNEPHIAVILDSCHSGSATRGEAQMEGARTRATLAVHEERPLDSYLDGQYAQMLKAGEELTLPESRHILLAACRRTQSALEMAGRGAFSQNLERVFDKHGTDLSYAELFSRCRAAMRVPKNQTPQFEAYGLFNGFTTFLGSTVKAQERHLVFFDKAVKDWVVNRGALHNMPSEPDVQAEMILYDDDGNNVGVARTTQVGMNDSRIEMPVGLDEPGEEQYKAEITSLPVPPIPVYLHGDEEGTKALEAVLTPIAGVSFVDDPKGLDYAVEARDGDLRLYHVASDKLIRGAKGYDEPSAKVVLGFLKDVVRWERTLALQNQNTKMNTDDLEFQVIETRKDGGTDVYDVRLDALHDRVFSVGDGGETAHAGNEIVLTYASETGDPKDDVQVKFRARNKSGQTLHVALLYFNEFFKVQDKRTDEITVVSASSGPEEGFMHLASAGSREGEGLMLDAGRNEETIWYKLIVSTERIDSQDLTMDGFEKLGVVEDDFRTAAPVQTRGERGDRSAKIKHKNEWFTKTVRIKIVRQLNEVTPQDVTVAGGNVKIAGHPSFKASINVTAAPQTTRGSSGGGDENVFAVLERQGLSMMTLSQTRGDAEPEHAIELNDIQNDGDLVDNPLELSLTLPLDELEQVLPVTFDGTHFLMVGDTEQQEDGSTTVRISHIPDAVSNRRSIGKSLILFFLKTKLNRKDVNTLSWVNYDAGAGVELTSSGVADQIAGASNVLLLVPGILGDAQVLAEALPRVVDAAGKALHGKYDVVLTYDYESLQTPIQETAGQLKQALETVGLNPSDDKKVAILAHGTGGLVARWLIEQSGAKETIDQLVMCGTPNGGSPLGMIGTARKVLSTISSLALNIPGAVAIVPTILLVLNRSKEFTKTLEQLDSSSDMLTTLNGSDDPGIPYTVLAGNIEKLDEASEGLTVKLLEKLGKSLVSKAVLGSKHDVLASVDSITGVSRSRSPLPETKEVGCHHLNYFSSEAGLQELASVDW